MNRVMTYHDDSTINIVRVLLLLLLLLLYKVFNNNEYIAVNILVPDAR